MIKLENDQYIVSLPEHGLRQPFDHDNKPFANEAAAQAWQDTFLSGLEAVRTRHEAEAAAQAEADAAAIVQLEVTADKTTAAVDEAINITATFVNGLGATVPIGTAFAVPILNDAGRVAKIKRVAFAAGVANVSVSFKESGYFMITEAGINRKLPLAQRIRLSEPFEVTVYE